MNMKKILLLIFCCCFSLMCMAKNKIAMKIDGKALVPRSLIEIPTVNQADAAINIHLADIISYTTVTIINNETGLQVYSMIYTGTNHIRIDLQNEDSGSYTLLLHVEGVEYTGDFVL